MYLICIYVIGNEKKQILELFNMKLSKTIDQTRICKKNYDDPLVYFCMGLFFLLVPTDKWPTNFTCPTDISTCPGQSDKRYCRGPGVYWSECIILNMCVYTVNFFLQTCFKLFLCTHFKYQMDSLKTNSTLYLTDPSNMIDDVLRL